MSAEQRKLFDVEPDPAYRPPNTRIDRDMRFAERRDREASRLEKKRGTEEERAKSRSWMPVTPLTQEQMAERGIRPQLRRSGLTSARHISERTAAVDEIARLLLKDTLPDERVELMFVVAYKPAIVFRAVDALLIPLSRTVSKDIAAGFRVNRRAMLREIVSKLRCRLFKTAEGDNTAY